SPSNHARSAASNCRSVTAMMDGALSFLRATSEWRVQQRSRALAGGVRGRMRAVSAIPAANPPRSGWDTDFTPPLRSRGMPPLSGTEAALADLPSRLSPASPPSVLLALRAASVESLLPSPPPNPPSPNGSGLGIDCDLY